MKTFINIGFKINSILLFTSWLGIILSPKNFWIFGLTNFFILPLLFIQLLYTIFLAKGLKINFLISLFLIGLSLPFIMNWLPSTNDSEAVDQESFSVMSFNVQLFNRYQWFINRAGVPKDIRNMIQTQNPDILCFQEYEINRNTYKGMYPYWFDLPKFTEGTPKTHNAIFSRFPLLNKRVIHFDNSKHIGMITDVVIKEKDTIRLLNFHLESFKLNIRSNDNLNSKSTNIFGQLRNGLKKHGAQIEIIQQEIKSSPFPVILCIDLNNLPTSYEYNTIAGLLRDTFKVKGTGLGTTYKFSNIPIRIDVIFVDKRFEVLSHKVIYEYLSDHFPIISNLSMKY